MRYRDNIEWLKSLKHQIGQSQHRDLWHFKQAIDEIIENLKPLAEPHGRLIDADALMECRLEPNHYEELKDGYIPDYDLDSAPTIIEVEVSE